MTRELENKLRRTYGNTAKNDLIEIIIELQKRNENLSEACIEAANVLNYAIQKMREAERVNGLLS